jgi:cytosine deaminase
MQTLRNASVPSAMLGRSGGGIERVDITIADGKVASIAPHAAGPGRDLDGGLVLPAFADIHTHIDKGQIWSRKSNPDGSFMGALTAVSDDRSARWTAEDVGRRMDFLLRCAYAHGSAAVRTHLDSVPAQAETSWAVFDQMRERWKDRVELQAVALMGPGELVDRPTVQQIGKIAQRVGGVLGGAMASDPKSAEAMLNVVEVAGELGLDIDMHCDETLDPGTAVLLHLAEAVLRTGYKGKVVAGHCCALSVQDDATAGRTIEKTAEAGIAIVSLPMCNMYLQDRAPGRTPRMRGVAPLAELRAAGIPVAVASDNVRDPFYAYGDMDGLEVLREAGRVLHFDHPQETAWGSARMMGADAAAIAGFTYRGEIAVGAPADLLLFRARTWTELFARPQADREVLRAGEAIDTTLPDYRELDDLMEA